MAGERGLKISLVISNTLVFAAAAAAITLYFDVRDLKRQVGSQIAKADIVELTGRVRLIEEVGMARNVAQDTLIADHASRLRSLERSRTREEDRR